MPISTFSFPTTIIFGPGAAERLPVELEQKGARRPLLVTDRGLRGTQVLARVHGLIPHAPLFTNVDPNPVEQNVGDGLEFYRAHGCDSIVGLGGGSAMDAAKAIRLKVTHKLPLADYDDLVDGWRKITADLPPFIALPTTAGTGSEVGRSTVITLAATNRKTVIFSPHLIASPAIVDPELTTSLPPHITAGAGMDALTHNVEAYLSRGYHPLCDAIAIAGAKLANDNLPVAMSDPANVAVRGNMLMASMMGAIAFQKGLGAAHSLAHPLSSECGLHHGTANAILLPWVLEFNRPAAQQALNTLEAHLDCPDLANRVRELNEICRIKPRLRDYHVPRELLPALAAKAYQDGCHQTNPRTATAAELLMLYQQAF